MCIRDRDHLYHSEYCISFRSKKLFREVVIEKEVGDLAKKLDSYAISQAKIAGETLGLEEAYDHNKQEEYQKLVKQVKDLESRFGDVVRSEVILSRVESKFSNLKIYYWVKNNSTKSFSEVSKALKKHTHISRDEDLINLYHQAKTEDLVCLLYTSDAADE